MQRILKVITIGALMIFSMSTIVYAAETKEKTLLELQIEQQEENLREDMPDLVPDDDTIINDTADTIKSTEYGDFNIDNKINTVTKFVNEYLIKTRSIVIVCYGLFVILITIYLSTIGSRSLNKRRHGTLLLIGNTILFILYINIPLFIIYIYALTEDTSSVFRITDIYSRILQLTDFLRSNSIIIGILLAYLGISKLIVSKNDLPLRIQGKYLVKASIIVIIVLNIAPLAIRFIL